MPDVYQPVKTGSIKDGTIITYCDKFGNTKSINPLVEHNIIVQQSGILDTRNDDKTYYTT